MNCKIEVNKNVQTEILKKSLIVSLTLMGIGILGLVLYVMFAIIFSNSSWKILLLIFSACLFGVTFGNYLILRSVIKQIEKNPFVNEYIFEETKISVSSHKLDGTSIADGSVPYDTILKVKETEKYFIIFISKGNVWPVDKDSLNPEERNFLRQKFISKAKLKVKR